MASDQGSVSIIELPQDNPGIHSWQAPACQPYGAVLVLDNNGRIVASTETTCSFLEAPDIAVLLGLDICSICPPLYDVWMERVTHDLDPRDWTRVRWNGHEFDARAVPFSGYWLVDVWPAADHGIGWGDVQTIATVVREWLQTQDFVLDDALERYRAWLGFDMVVMYELESNGENEITAEAKVAGLPSLKGLHYPVSQMGSFADAIGYHNVARAIVDSTAPSTSWWTMDREIDPAIANLSVCRELDPYHRHMMAKMGFTTALMLPLVMDGHVRGLLIAYHREPRIIGGSAMLVSRTFSQSLSLKVNEHALRTRFAYEKKLVKAMSDVEAAVRTRSPDLETLLEKHHSQIQAMVHADGVVLWRHASSTAHAYGDTVDASLPAVRAWMEWLNFRIPHSIDAYGTGVFVTDFLEGSWAQWRYASHELGKVCGCLALRLPNRDLVVFTRLEAPRLLDMQNVLNLEWGPTSIRTLRGHALSWRSAERRNAVSFLSVLCEQYQHGGEHRTLGVPDIQSEMVLLFAKDGRIVFMNAPAREGIGRILTPSPSSNGYTLQDLLDAMPVEQHGRVRNAFKVALAKGRWEGEVEIFMPFVQAVYKGVLQTHGQGDDLVFSWTAKDATALSRAKYEQACLAELTPLAIPLSSEAFRSQLAKQLELHKRNDIETPGLLLLIDLDGTKNFIKAIGQVATDEISYWIHRRLLHTLGADVTVSHIGTDEFAIIVPKVQNEKQAWLMANSVLTAISQPLCLDNYVSEDPIQLTGCVGMALFLSHASTVQDLLIAADNAMYAAKRAGKGQARMHDPHSSTNVSQKFHLVGELRRAIQNNELRAYFQPQLNALTHKIVGAEALVRWEHPERGLLLPNMFISVAEDSGLIDKLGEWVLHDTLRQLSAWPREYRENMVVSVNASVRQLRDQENFLYTLDAALNKYNVSPKNLEIEITETIWIDKQDEAVNTLHELQARGVSVAIDDFGTGYSNIAYLQSFPVDKLKFDRSFVVAGQESNGGKEILRAMVQLARALNVQVLAEGVETKEQEAMLLDVGIENMQGFAYSRPLSEKAFLTLLERQLGFHHAKISG